MAQPPAPPDLQPPPAPPDQPSELPARVPTLWRVVAEAAAIDHNAPADWARRQRERRLELTGWLVSLAVLLGAAALAWHQHAAPAPPEGVTVQLM